MNPLSSAMIVASRPLSCVRQCVLTLTLVLPFCILSVQSTANAQKRDSVKKKKAPTAKVKVKEKKNKKGGKDQTFDFTGLSLGGSVRTPQLLYFLDRATEELKRASLERRSFIPEMVRSISEEGL